MNRKIQPRSKLRGMHPVAIQVVESGTIQMDSINFILNADTVDAKVSPETRLLDFLRLEAHLMGTKEGCREGDCGSCTVLVGELVRDRISYHPMTSCLIPMGELHGKHVVTIEGLGNASCTTVQEAIIESGGTQCGYCTPGFVMSMTAWTIDPEIPLTLDGLNYAISGNLCRCTGYRSIKTAGIAVSAKLRPKLRSKDRVRDLCAHKELPEYFIKIEARLRELNQELTDRSDHDSGSTMMAGGTDLYVQQGDRMPHTHLHFVNRQQSPSPVRSDGTWLYVDAAMSMEAFGREKLIRETVPEISCYLETIASWPVRTRATLGGNICNGSPAADMTCLLLALGTEIQIKDRHLRRWLPLRDFYLGYKKLNKSPEETVSEIRFPAPSSNTLINWEKVSKRPYLDIASVNSAIRIEVTNGTIHSANLAIGGVSPTPMVSQQAGQYLAGKPVSLETALTTANLALNEINPISDIRGTAKYKQLLSRQLILSHFSTLFPAQITPQHLHEALR